jgi:hypothetical protein
MLVAYISYITCTPVLVEALLIALRKIIVIRSLIRTAKPEALSKFGSCCIKRIIELFVGKKVIVVGILVDFGCVEVS